MATADVPPTSADSKTANGVEQADKSPTADPPIKKRSPRRKTAHLKLVPETKALREELREKCRQLASRLDRENPLTKDEMETLARQLLKECGQPEGYVGWIMVVLSSAFWEDQVAHVPPSRRLFLLPHCLKHAEGCPADYDEFGLDCETCGACSIADFRTIAEKMGYKVLVAEGSPIVLKIIVSGHVDAIVGVACLNVLEKAIDKILLAGIPCMAIPLLSSDCRNTSVDEDWVNEMIHVQPANQPGEATSTRTYLHLMRASQQLFQPERLREVAPPVRAADAAATLAAGELDPIAGTEQLAYDFLGKGGKYSRPFITLAVHDALTGGQGTTESGEQHLRELDDSIYRTAMAIEAFHKASLVHDDIEDDDNHRYGDETVHRQYGIPTAINVGDYLIGLGYRLAAQDAAKLGPATSADILNRFAHAHMKLSEGQGAELLWRDAREKRLAPIDALKIYALKTSPAFEAALYAGIRLAGGEANEFAALDEPLRKFARNMGVGFQILNDLKDWQGDTDNKLSAGGDVLGGRPTLLLALALESLPAAEQAELLALVSNDEHSDQHRVRRTEQLFKQAGVFEKAERLVDKHQQRAESIADEIEPEELRRLLYYLIDTVLDRPGDSTPVTLASADIPVLSDSLTANVSKS